MNRNNSSSCSGANRSNGTYYTGRTGMQRGTSGYARPNNNSCNTNNCTSMNHQTCENHCEANTCENNNNNSCVNTETVVVVVRENDCEGAESRECRPSMNDPIACMPLAMAYVPWQDYEAIYSEAEAWEKGTIFCKLDLDFIARRCN